MKSARSVFAGLLALALLAPAARAQSADSTQNAAASLSPAGTQAVKAVPQQAEQAESPAARAAQGPTLDAATVGIRPAQPGATVLPASAQQQGGFGRSETLMIVGGAAFVAGLIIGDDAGTIVMVSGAAIGLYGLYLYLQTH